LSLLVVIVMSNCFVLYTGHDNKIFTYLLTHTIYVTYM